MTSSGTSDVLVAYRVGAWVTHERLDDEVIAIDLETGAYFALEGVAAECWSGIARGLSLEAVAAAITAQYDVDHETARRDVDQFARQLAEERLVEPADAAPGAVGELPAGSSTKAYAAPSIEKFDDLQELLLLDPVHEVDEAGWPIPRAE
jgi:hypothetical protein